MADCHEKMVALMKDFFDLLKTTPGDEGAISKAVITGCLKVAKNSLFTGVNNFKVNTVLATNKDLTGIIGFTKDETLKFLKDYETSLKKLKSIMTVINSVTKRCSAHGM